MIKRLIFDIDGTLITGANFEKAQEKMLKNCKIYSEENYENLTLAIENYEKYHNNYNRKDFMKHIRETLKINLPSNFEDEFFKECKKVITSTGEKLQKLLQNLSTKYEMVLLSNFFEEVQRKRLENMGIGHFFTEYYGEKLTKPNKQAHIEACGVNKFEECVMIGDNFELDITPARELGINTIYINSKKEKVIFSDVISVEKVEDITEEMLEAIDKKEILV